MAFNPKTAFAVYTYLWRVLTSHVPYGKSVFSEDWDLLIVLDACRVDALQEVKSEYPFIEGIDSIRSRGSTSKEWIDNTFTEKYSRIINDTAYITSNGFTHRLQDNSAVNPLDMSEIRDTPLEGHDYLNHLIKKKTISGEFAYFEQVEDVMGKSDAPDILERPVPSPEVLTNRAIRAGREQQHDRMIVHYMQPHAPFIHEALDRGYFKEHEENPFAYLKNGGDQSIVWNAYLDNLRFALDNVERLINNYDGEKVVITADHGELFGEWGLYSHMCGIPHPNLRRVPWVETTSTDNGSPVPQPSSNGYIPADDSETSVEDRLKALGYR